MIDDNPIEHLIVEKMCERYRLFHDIVHAADGRKILSLLENNEVNISQLPDLIFLDLHMPEFSGWDFLQKLETIYNDLQRPVIVYVVSSSIDQDEKQRSQMYPFVKDFLTKPLKQETLKYIFDQHTNVA